MLSHLAVPDERPQNKLLVIGCHHKTGTTLLFKIGAAIAERLWRRDQLVVGSSAIRKQPLSKVLQSFGKDICCYFNPWFEHEVDLPSSNIRFLHFVRHPVKWVRSGYLYHKKGGPAESIRWLDWRVFRLGSRRLSYYELLNSVDEGMGASIEAVRSFPEIAGTARASYSSAGLTTKKILSLEHFQTDFNASVRSLGEFVGLDSAQINQVVLDMRAHDFSGPHHGLRPNMTYKSESADRIESRLALDPGFRKLYTGLAEQMGFTWNRSAAEPGCSCLSNVLIERILGFKDQLLMDAASPEAQESLRSPSSRDSWLAYALQSFGEGHLLMYDFIQQMIEQTGAGSCADELLPGYPLVSAPVC